MRCRLLGVPQSSLGKGHISSSLKLKNRQEISFCIAGFKAQILKWNTGPAQNTVALRPRERTHLTGVGRLGRERQLQHRVGGDPQSPGVCAAPGA